MKTIDSTYPECLINWFIKCSKKHQSGMPLCTVLFNPLQEQNHNASYNAEEQTHVKAR